MYLSEVAQWGGQDLMFQSKLSSSVSYDTKLLRRVFRFGSGTDYVANDLQKEIGFELGLTFLGNTLSARI